MANLEHAEEDSKHVKMSGETPAATSNDPPIGLSAGPARDVTAVPSLIPSFAAAAELLSAPYSCLVMSTHRRHVALPPVYLHKKRTGIQGELEAELLRFSEGLEGVPLAYDNIRIVGQRGDIYDDSGYVHMDIEADFIMFQPKKGQKLLGKVNKLGVGHVGCLVHGCFNASIPKPNLVAVETWRDAGPRIGSDLEFEVMALDSDTVGVLLIRGRLERTKVQELMAIGESSESSVPADQPDSADTETKAQTPEMSPEDSCEKKKKKKKKNKIKEEETEEDVTASCQQDSVQTPSPTMEDTNGNEESPRKKRKKKKDKHVKEEMEEEGEDGSHVCIQGSDSSGYVSDKPAKKRKRETNNNDTGVSHEELPPAKSKKRKSKVEQ